MIVLTPEVASGLGEDTFWTWIKREFPDSVFDASPKHLSSEDVVLRYSTMGKSSNFQNSIALLWELHPEMKRALNSNKFDPVIQKIDECAQSCKFRTTPTELTKTFYPDVENIKVMPIGVDTDLFRPAADKVALRRKWNVPLDKRVIFWGGTTHPMKGFSHLQAWKRSNPDTHFIIVWKTHSEAGHLPGAQEYTHISQEQIAELMGCADSFLSCGILRPFFMLEWEAMACNLQIINMHSLSKDFIPSQNPRDDVFGLKWDRATAKNSWRTYFDSIVAENK